MANPSERGSSNPYPGTHPRVTAQPATSSHSPSQQGESLSGQVSSMAGQVRDTLQSAASEVSSRVSNAGESIRRGMREGEHWVEETAGDILSSMTSVIRRNPILAIAGAFGAGCLLTCCIAAWTSGSTDWSRRESNYLR